MKVINDTRAHYLIYFLIVLSFIVFLFSGCYKISEVPKIDITPVFNKDGTINKEVICKDGETYSSENQCLEDCSFEFQLFGNSLINNTQDVISNFRVYEQCSENQDYFKEYKIKDYERQIDLTNKFIEGK